MQAITTGETTHALYRSSDDRRARRSGDPAPRHRGVHHPATTPISTETDADRILLKNLTKDALSQLEAAGANKRRINDLIEELDDLVEDDEFRRFQAHGLAVFATPYNRRTLTRLHAACSCPTARC